MKAAVYCFGRFQPPTIGHAKVFDAVANAARTHKADAYMFASQSHKKTKFDNKSCNPLLYDMKMDYLKKMFPQYASNFVVDKSVVTFLHAATWLYMKDYTHLYMVAGSDRVDSYTEKLNQYNCQPDKSGETIFCFRSIEVISAGTRDPDADGAQGMSGTKMRKAAQDLETTAFMSGIPNTLSIDQKLELMHDVRAGLVLPKENK